ncbi:MAG: EF-hand domain-containing protein [Flavobacteriaceae bacterium]
MKTKMDAKKKTLLIAGVAAIALTGITAGAVQADGRWHERDGFRGERHGMMGGHDMMGGPGMMGGRGDLIRRLAEDADTDKDGKLTQAEIDAAQNARFEKYDADKDGKLNLDEFQNLLTEVMRPMTVRAFQRMDPDGDAAITKDEFDKPLSNIVERMDRNDDGALSRDDRPSRHGWNRDNDDDRPHRWMKDGERPGREDGQGPGPKKDQ